MPRYIWYYLAAGILLITGIVIGVIQVVRNIVWRRGVGVVMQFAQEWQDDAAGGRVMTAPVVRFTTDESREFTFRDGVWSRPSGYQIGQKVRVLYDPRDPRRAAILGWKRYSRPVILVLASVLAFVIAESDRRASR